MHFLGLAGMPRRISDYPDAFAPWNFIASLGSFISIGATLFFFYLVYNMFSTGAIINIRSIWKDTPRYVCPLVMKQGSPKISSSVLLLLLHYSSK